MSTVFPLLRDIYGAREGMVAEFKDLDMRMGAGVVVSILLTTAVILMMVSMIRMVNV